MRKASFPLLALALAAAPVAAQTLGPQLSGQPAALRVAADIGERAAEFQPIKGAGPAAEAPADLAASSAAVEPAAVRRNATGVVGVGGKPLPGAVRIAHNRIYDPLSGRYYWTTGAGPGEVVLP